MPLSPDCCPSGWLLYHGKCIFISAAKKSWWDSYWDCVEKHSRLLVQGESELWVLPVSMGGCGSPAGCPHCLLPPSCCMAHWEHSWSQRSWPPGMRQILDSFFPHSIFCNQTVPSTGLEEYTNGR